MSEKGERGGRPRFMPTIEKPQEIEGYRWEAKRERGSNRILGWMPVSTESSPEEKFNPFPKGPTPEQLQESRERSFPSIEDSQTTGDKD